MSQKLELIFDNIDVLQAKENYMVLPNETYDLLALLDSAKILPLHRGLMILKVLTFKHDEKNPFPSHDRLQSDWDIKSPTTIKNYFKDIVGSGLFLVEKGLYGLDKRKNTYNVQPFLDLLGLFVEAVRSGVDVCIKTLVKEVLAGRTATRTARKKEKKQEEVKLSENITTALSSVSESRKEVYIKYITINSKRLDEETIVHTIEKIEKFYDDSKGNFNGYVSKVFKSASNGDKAKDEAKALENENKRKTTPSRKSVRTEMLPDWLDKENEKKEFDENEYDPNVPLNEAIEISREFCVNMFIKETGKEFNPNDFDFKMWVMEKGQGLPYEKNDNLEVVIYNHYGNPNLKLRTS